MKINKKNILISLVSALIISIPRGIAIKSLIVFIVDLITVFLIVFIACGFVDSFYRIKKEKEVQNGINKQNKQNKRVD